MTGSDGQDGFALPLGTVAFLLTDIEGSTKRWESEPDAMAAAMGRHASILDAAISAHRGVCPPAQGEGDSVVAAFARASDAVRAARDAQLALEAEAWPTSEPLRVRMAVHAGEARVVDDGNYAGQAIIRTARLRAVSSGGQILVSAPARDLTVDQLGDEIPFRDLGEHRLRDLARPERVYQVLDGGLPDRFEALRSLDAHPHNLPIQLSSFIGRTDEIAIVARLLETSRLVTVAGAGGAGKTRLAQHVAAEVLDRYADGVWWIELAEVSDPTVSAATISAAVGLKGEVHGAAVDVLADRLGERHALLVLDNCEHLVDTIAPLVDHLLHRCPGVAVLATSREPLDVGGEVAWRIPPLRIPTGPDAIPIGALTQYDSVRLFVDRARAARPNFRITDDNGPAIAAICNRLDGIPLAIELAAARTRSLTPERILDGLTNAFRLLTSGARTALPRQQTLEASIAWSHDLLQRDEQVLLRRLSVFTGGCTLDDAELVVADELLDDVAVVDLLDRLVVQSLVQLDDDAAVPRYHLLETVRQYAARHLEAAGETDSLRRRHADRFVEVAEEIGVALCGGDERPAHARATAERDNLAAAADWLASGQRWADHARLVLGVAEARILTEPLRSIRDLSTAIGHATDASTRSRLLAARAMAYGFYFDPLAALADLADVSPLAEAIGDLRSLTLAETVRGYLLCHVDPPAADATLERASVLAAECGDPYVSAWTAVVRVVVIGAFKNSSPEWYELEVDARAAVDGLGSQLLGCLLDAACAAALCQQGRIDAAVTLIDRAEESLAGLADAAGLPLPYLLRNSPPGYAVLFCRSWLAFYGVRSVDLEEITRTIEVARSEDQRFVSIGVLMITAMAHQRAGDAPRAIEASIDVTEQTTALGLVYWFTGAKVCEAYVRYEAGDPAAREVIESLGPLVEVSTNRSLVARERHFLGALALRDGEIAEAERLAHESLTIAHRHDYRFDGAMTLELLARIAATTSSPLEAVRLVAAAARLRTDSGMGDLAAIDRDRILEVVAAARVALGDDVFATAWAEGDALSFDDAVAYAQRARGERKRPSLGWESLTPTELLVVEQVQAGRTNPEIGDALFMSRSTVKTHLSHIFAKLAITSRSELAAASARRADHA